VEEEEEDDATDLVSAAATRCGQRAVAQQRRGRGGGFSRREWRIKVCSSVPRTNRIELSFQIAQMMKLFELL
jgi:hypothetical protein